jgi:hypothetical protein
VNNKKRKSLGIAHLIKIAYKATTFTFEAQIDQDAKLESQIVGVLGTRAHGRVMPRLRELGDGIDSVQVMENDSYTRTDHRR